MFNVPSSPPPEERECPACGEMMPAKADLCWLCLRKSIKEEPAPAPVRKRRQKAPRHEPKPWFSQPSSVFVGIIVVLLFGVLAYEVPGLAFIPLIVVIPVLVRKLEGWNQKTRDAARANGGTDSNQLSVPSILLGVLNWLGIAIAVGAAAFG